MEQAQVSTHAPIPDDQNPEATIFDPSAYKVMFGAHRGKTIQMMFDEKQANGTSALENYVEYLDRGVRESKKQLVGTVKEFREVAKMFLTDGEDMPQ